ncbi:hypothetical protein P692DRAFT_20220197 [Suillus brevipes Sb2]|nr:hypothetical protein P692DRAFT_20220197 [Suillus brevipes Sb2]
MPCPKTPPPCIALRQHRGCSISASLDRAFKKQWYRTCKCWITHESRELRAFSVFFFDDIVALFFTNGTIFLPKKNARIGDVECPEMDGT